MCVCVSRVYVPFIYTVGLTYCVWRGIIPFADIVEGSFVHDALTSVELIERRDSHRRLQGATTTVERVDAKISSKDVGTREIPTIS